MRRLTHLFGFVLLACQASISPAALAAPDVALVLLDGRRVTGRIESLAPDVALRTTEGIVRLDWSELLELTPLVAEPEFPASSGDPLRFSFADGSSIGGRVDQQRPEEFQIRLRSGQVLWARTDALTGIRAPRGSADALRRLEAAAAARDAGEDVLIIAREERIAELRGTVSSIAAQGVDFAYGDRTLTVPWERVAGVVFRRRTPRDSSVLVVLHGDDAVAGRVIGGGGDALLVQSGVLGRVSLAWPRIERIEVRSDRVMFLSDVEPDEFDFEPFFSRRWPPAYNQTLTGRPIVLGGRTYPKGIVVHSRAALRYALGGRFSRFVALAGIVDEIGAHGDVRMAVIGDGRLLWERESVRGGDEPFEVVVDVSGVRTLELRVDFGDGLDVGDHACWALARLIR